MTCAFAVRGALKKLSGVESVDVSLNKGLASVKLKSGNTLRPEELWETTLDPEKRTLLRVQLDDALKADDMFRTLMGEKVEPRRDFIQEHALDAKDIDLHGA